MAISSLSAQYISASFQNLIQISSSGQVFDGLGNTITNLTASFATTSSHALNAVSASFATQALSSSFASTASFAPNYVLTSATSSMLQPYVLTSQTSSMSVASASVATSASYALNAGTASFATTASHALNAGTVIDTGSFATTRSNTFNGSQTINGDLTVTGSIIAYQYIVSSSVINETIVFSSGSTIFGNSLDDTHIFTGSLSVTGSITTTDEITIKGTNVSASLANLQIASSSLNIQISNLTSATASYATTGSNTFIGNQTITGSLFVTQSHISTVDYIDYTLLSAEPSHLEGRVHWFDDTKTLQIDTDVNNFSIEVGHQNTIRVRNTTGGNLNAGKIVYINGESGNRPTVATASWDSDPTSTTTLGFVAQQINNAQTGYVISSGIFRNIDTTAFSPGTQLYLSSSGDFTSTVPVSSKHEVRLGKTITQAVSGVIYVDIMNGYEIGELHDVLAVSSSNGDLLVYSGSIWINTKQLTGSYSVTGSLLVSGSSTFKVIGPSEFTGSVAINGTLSAPAASITAQSVTSNTVTATNYVSGSQLAIPGMIISSSIGDAFDTSLNSSAAFTTTIRPNNNTIFSQPLAISSFYDVIYQSPNLYINPGDNLNGIYSGMVFNASFIGIPTHFKTPYTNATVGRQNAVYIGTTAAHPVDRSNNLATDGLSAPAPALTILPFSGSFISGQWVTRRANQIGINKYDSEYLNNYNNGYEPQQMGNLSATLDVNGSTVISGSLTVTASINARSVTASLFGTASYAVNSLTASYALSGGSGGTSSTVSTAQTGSVTGTTSETLIQTLTIPANTLSTNDFARFSTKIFATNSNNYTVALYINSANTLNGSQKNITTLPVNSSIKFVIPTRTIAVNNVTTDTNWISENTQVQEPVQGSSATAHESSSINWTTTQYALVSVTPQNAGDSFICRGTYFEKI